VTIVEANDYHPEMQKIRNDRKKCRLLATVLGSRRGERSPDLSMQCATHPETAGLVEKIGHLRRQASKSRARPDDNCIVVGEIFNLRNWRLLIDLVV